MPSRQIAAKELSAIFGVLAHADRIRIVEELRKGEKDVSSLAQMLGLTISRVSQHLRLLRLHHIVEERREGRHHFYHLNHPELATWIVQGLSFVETEIVGITKTNIKSARRLWTK